MNLPLLWLDMLVFLLYLKRSLRQAQRAFLLGKLLMQQVNCSRKKQIIFERELPLLLA